MQGEASAGDARQFRLHIRTLRVIAAGVVVVCLGLIVIAACNPPFLNMLAGRRSMTDFDAIYLAVQMIGEGRLLDAYNFEMLHAEQLARIGSGTVMTWSYPPQYNLVVAPLAWLPRDAAYLVAVGGSLGVYLFVLHRVAGVWTALSLIAVAPALMTCARMGQNGFLTGALWGGWALMFTGHCRFTGGLLGLMVIKPQFGLSMGFLTLLHRDWRALALAVGVVVVSGIAATLAFGAGVWAAFRASAAHMSGLLYSGYFEITASVYNAARTLGAGPDTAMVIQVGVAVLAGGMLVILFRSGAGRRVEAGFALLTAPLWSPYGFAYDYPVLGMAIGLLLPVIARSVRRAESVLLICAMPVVTGGGVMSNALDYWRLMRTDPNMPFTSLPNLSGPLLVLLSVAIFRVLLRDIRAKGERPPGHSANTFPRASDLLCRPDA